MPLLKNEPDWIKQYCTYNLYWHWSYAGAYHQFPDSSIDESTEKMENAR
jgi:hypothetical protein